MRLKNEQTRRIMKVVAEEMGVEFGKDLNVGNKTIRLNSKGVELPYEDDPNIRNDDGFKAWVTGHIILGKIEYIKVPWKPQKDDLYYFPTPTRPDGFDCEVWQDRDVDLFRYEKLGAYKTIKEATQKAKELGWLE